MSAWIEALIALAVMLLHVALTFRYTPAQVEHHPMRVRIGAAIQGAALGAILGFVILPLRMTLMAPPADPHAGVSLLYLPAFALLIVVRRGLLYRAPLISPYMRAYRRANLLRTLDVTRKQLTKLDEFEGKGGGRGYTAKRGPDGASRSERLAEEAPA